MEYITKPHVLTDTETRLLGVIRLEGVWRPWPSELTYDELSALLSLRNHGIIEYAAYGGYKVKASSPKPQPAPVADIARLEAALASAGITPTRPLSVVESGAFKRTYSNAPSIAIRLPTGATLPPAVADMIEQGAYVSGSFYVVQLKS